jgi:TonB-linked SusC/RagA family outer membrane protein
MDARRFGVGWGMALVLSMVLVGDAWAQGSVTGRVVQSSTLRPLAGAQVSIPGTGIGALANNDGRYLLVNVPVGQHTVRVEIIGFATQERSVTVTAGQSVAADFQLETQALGLDEIVVTGTAGGVQRRAIGNVVATVSAEKQLEARNPESVQTLLSGSTPGVMINVGVGNVGAGGNIVIRGMSTMGGSGSAVLGTSAPILIIDGVRANGGTDGQASGGATSRLNDINPEDIERIEIIKGPAAATLYGTEATNGVIQIVTKKGALGSGTSVDVSLRQGAAWFNNPTFPDNYGLAADGRTILQQNPYNEEIAAGNKVFRTGQLQSYGLSMRGGQQRLSYFMSGAYDDDEGYFNNNELKRMSLRTNLQLAINDRLDLSGDVGVISSETTFADTGTGGTSGMMAMILWGNPITKSGPQRGFMVAPPEFQDAIDSRQKMNRQTASITTAYRATEWLAQRLVVGFDRTDLVSSKFFPKTDQLFQAYAENSAGRKNVENEREVHQTIDYNITAQLEPITNVTSATSFGVQYFAKSTLRSTAEGRNFPTPSVSTVTAGSVRTATETFEENKTFGMFVQETVGWRNQAFLTAALRGDANSAFGESFDAAYYPKLSATWTASDAFTLPSVNSLRLRAAWGRSGLQPTTFAAVRTYEPLIATGDAAGVRPGNVGNPDLKPEVATELELGLDAALFNNRATLEISRYDRTTRDAILNQEVPPSEGFLGTKFVNIGEISNKGWEFKLEVTPVQTSLIQLTLGGSLSLNKNKINDLGGLVIAADTRGRWQNLEGYEIGSMWSKYVHTASWGGANGTTLTNVKCYGGPPGVRNVPAEEMGKYPDVECAVAPHFYVGSPGPNRNGGLTQTLSIGNSLTLNANWVYWGDSRTFSTTEWYRDKPQANSYLFIQSRLGQGDPVRAAAIQLADIDHVYMSRDDFLRLREIGLSYNLPTSWTEGFGVSRASLLVSAQNMFIWIHPEYTDDTDGRFKNLDPEARANRSVLYGFQQATSILPHSLTTTLRMTF